MSKKDIPPKETNNPETKKPSKKEKAKKLVGQIAEINKEKVEIIKDEEQIGIEKGELVTELDNVKQIKEAEKITLAAKQEEIKRLEELKKTQNETTEPVVIEKEPVVTKNETFTTGNIVDLGEEKPALISKEEYNNITNIEIEDEKEITKDEVEKTEQKVERPADIDAMEKAIEKAIEVGDETTLLNHMTDVVGKREPTPPVAPIIAVEKNLAELKTENDTARKNYFDLLNNKPKTEKSWFGKIKNKKEIDDYEVKIKEAEEIYSISKIESAKKLISESKKEEAQSFLMGEIELKRKNNLENGPLSRKIIEKVGKGIKYWEEIGNKESDSKGVRAAKKIAKNIAAVAVIGGTSAAIVSAFAAVGAGTATAVTAGYFGKRMLMTAGFSTAMAAIPDPLKPAAGVMMTGLMLTSYAGAAGLLASKISAFATKKWWSEKAIINKTEEKIKKINLDTLDTDLKNLELQCEQIIKDAEKKRVYRRLLAGVTALGTSVAFLEVAGHNIDNLKHQEEIKREAEAKNEQEVRQEEEIKQQEETKQQEQIKNDAETKNPETESHDQDVKHDNEQTQGGTIQQEGSTQELMKINSTQLAIKLGMYTPGSSAESMIVQQGTLSFVDESGQRIEVPYSSSGAIQTIENLKIELAEHYGNMSNVPNGHLETNFIDMKGVEHDQILTENSGNTQTINQYKGDMFDSGKNTTQTENIVDNKYEAPTQTDLEGNTLDGNKLQMQDMADYSAPIQTDLEGNQLDYSAPIQTDLNGNPLENNNIENQQEIQNNPEKINLQGSEGNDVNSEQAGIESTKEVDASPRLSPEEILSPNTEEYNNIINHVFTTNEGSALWTRVENFHGFAHTLLHANPEEVKVEFQPLQHLLQQLHDLTGCEPSEKVGLSIGDSPKEYINTVLETAKQDKIDLSKIDYSIINNSKN